LSTIWKRIFFLRFQIASFLKRTPKRYIFCDLVLNRTFGLWNFSAKRNLKILTPLKDMHCIHHLSIQSNCLPPHYPPQLQPPPLPLILYFQHQCNRHCCCSGHYHELITSSYVVLTRLLFHNTRCRSENADG
jgi:hypothetical protein